ncbi:hypothetical protein ABIE41_000129 [Bosea sp. OAE506]|uniref:hypothetical protein n=1 Tax=Bosea sp. OAE506 TaxID=2663870 RepID=UPI001788FAF5
MLRSNRLDVDFDRKGRADPHHCHYETGSLTALAPNTSSALSVSSAVITSADSADRADSLISTRLQLTALGDHLDSRIGAAGRSKLTIRDALMLFSSARSRVATSAA